MQDPKAAKSAYLDDLSVFAPGDRVWLHLPYPVNSINCPVSVVSSSLTTLVGKTQDEDASLTGWNISGLLEYDPRFGYEGWCRSTRKDARCVSVIVDGFDHVAKTFAAHANNACSGWRPRLASRKESWDALEREITVVDEHGCPKHTICGWKRPAWYSSMDFHEEFPSATMTPDQLREHLNMTPEIALRELLHAGYRLIPPNPPLAPLEPRETILRRALQVLDAHGCKTEEQPTG